jgi:hypothetical protein
MSMIGHARSNENYTNMFSNHTNRNDVKDSAAFHQLENRLNKIELIAEALWNLLKDKTDLTDNDLMDMVTEVDLQDGQLDGKATKIPFVECSQCHRKSNKSHYKCLYCGQEFKVTPFQ